MAVGPQAGGCIEAGVSRSGRAQDELILQARAEPREREGESLGIQTHPPQPLRKVLSGRGPGSCRGCLRQKKPEASGIL